MNRFTTADFELITLWSCIDF